MIKDIIDGKNVLITKFEECSIREKFESDLWINNNKVVKNRIPSISYGVGSYITDNAIKKLIYVKVKGKR